VRTYLPTMPTQRLLGLAIPLTAVAWLVTVPGVVTTSSFLAVVGLVSGLLWVARATYENGQAPASLPQVLHDEAQATSFAPPRDDR